ncbi:adenylosuccinate synthase [Castellaniella sp.]|uniref:adenylosuccinate synthase n=1 Tax=Castellaniella sp. TaxID=1955812 RepID=UPI002AFE3660|nr:adenylosuccinate synthase [Castellaniella sp.]
MTHKDLCTLALKWLKRPNSAGGPGCAVAVSECRTGWAGEVPDAIGFRYTGHAPRDGSVLVEVKVSRSDFLADAKKPHRISGGVGSWRYYMAPEGVLQLSDLPDGWGLLEVNGRGHIKIRAGHAVHFKGRHDEYIRQAALWRFRDVDLLREQFLLVRTIANAGDPQKVLDVLRDASNRNARLLAEVERLRNRNQKLYAEVVAGRPDPGAPIPRKVA